MKIYFRYIILFLAAVVCGMTAQASASGSFENAGELPDESLKPVVSLADGVLEVENPSLEDCPVTVVAITGRIVRQTSVAPGDKLKIELPAGIYVVKAGNTASRIAVR